MHVRSLCKHWRRRRMPLTSTFSELCVYQLSIGLPDGLKLRNRFTASGNVRFGSKAGVEGLPNYQLCLTRVQLHPRCKMFGCAASKRRTASASCSTAVRLHYVLVRRFPVVPPAPTGFLSPYPCFFKLL